MTTQETAILTFHTFRMLGFDNLLLLVFFKNIHLHFVRHTGQTILISLNYINNINS